MFEVHRTHRAGLIAGAIAGLGGLAWWEGEQHYATPAARWSVGGTILVLVLSAVLFGARRQRGRSAAWLAGSARALRGEDSRPWPYPIGIAVWVVIFAVVIGWDLFSFLRQSHDLPTLSYLFGRVTRYRVGRTAVYVAWIAAGVYLAAASRRKTA